MHQLGVDPSDLISTTSSVDIDLTSGTPYQELVAEEIEHYSTIPVTDDLKEGGVHAHKSWSFYYDYLNKSLFGRGFADEVTVQAEQFERPRLLSLGCGYGGHELEIARTLRRPYQLVGVDLNPHIFNGAQRRATSEGLGVQFKSLDLNFVHIRPNTFDVIYAHASVHHLLNLEHFFSQVSEGLTKNGRLVILDIIGKTQVLFWKENVEFAASLITRMPRRYRPPVGKRLWKHVWFDPYSILSPYKEPAEQSGMEGIRQEEIEFVMLRWLTPIKLARYDAYMRMICTSPHLGIRLDQSKDDDRECLEEIRLELQQVETGKLKPTEMFGVFRRIKQQ